MGPLRVCRAPRVISKKKNRYGKRKQVMGPDGRKYDSKKEMKRGQDLLMLERAGHIRNLQFQVRIPIVIGSVKVIYPSGRQMRYVSDFTYYDIDKREEIIEDVKMDSGFLTETYRIKRALIHTMGLTITEV